MGDLKLNKWCVSFQAPVECQFYINILIHWGHKTPKPAKQPRFSALTSVNNQHIISLLNVSGQWAKLSDVGHRTTRRYICLESCAPRCNRDQMCALAPARSVGHCPHLVPHSHAQPEFACAVPSLRSLACVGSAQRAHRCQSAPAPCSGRSLLLLVVCALWRLTAGIFLEGSGNSRCYFQDSPRIPDIFLPRRSVSESVSRCDRRGRRGGERSEIRSEELEEAQRRSDVPLCRFSLNAGSILFQFFFHSGSTSARRCLVAQLRGFHTESLPLLTHGFQPPKIVCLSCLWIILFLPLQEMMASCSLPVAGLCCWSSQDAGDPTATTSLTLRQFSLIIIFFFGRKKPPPPLLPHWTLHPLPLPRLSFICFSF